MQVVLTIFLFHTTHSKFYDSYKFTLCFLLDSHFNKKYFSFHWVLVALETRTMTAYYLDPMLHQPCDDLKDIVNM